MEASLTRVLLVEDEISDALVVKRSLHAERSSGERFDVEHETTLAQGIERLHRTPVDVLLVDLRLPDSEGPATVAQLRDRDARVPLVVFTGNDDPGVAARAFEAGADEYLVKDDLGGRLLRRTLRHAIARRRAGASGEREVRERERSDGQRALLHDLKNLHTTIVGNARILQRETGEATFLRQRADWLLGAARAAVDLVHKLAGDECEQAASGLLDLSVSVRAAEPLLRAALSREVELTLDLAERPTFVTACPEEIRRILLELVVNAAEAIGDGPGRVEVRTGHALLAEPDLSDLVADHAIAPGRYAWLEVRDDGIGFGAATAERLFERGFTIKGAGRGRGLGQVREALARYRAGLRVRSSPGGGASFRMLLPTAE